MADIFISMPFAFDFQEVSRALEDTARELSLSSYRTDQETRAKLIPELIQREIKASRLVVADVTGNNPNVLNEIGIAQGLGKPLILLSQNAATEAAFNVRSLGILTYSRNDLERLQKNLRESFAELLSDKETLRAMLVPSSLGLPTRDSWFVVAASPLSFRRAVGRSGGYKHLRRTSSDYVGVRSILQAFGYIFGFDILPDNIDPEDFDDGALQESMNIYCIASPKANRWTGILLEEYRRKWKPGLEFRADSSSKNLRNVKIAIFDDDGSEVRPRGWDAINPGGPYNRDYGLIVRGPNPFQEDKMMTVIAGRSSLGTEAASLAFTDPQVIKERIRPRLHAQGIDLEDHRQPFWAVASMKRAIGDGKEEALRETLAVHQVEAFRRSETSEAADRSRG